MKKKQDKILSSLLKHVPFEGWTEKALRLATQDSGLPEHYEKIAFKNGVSEVVELFLNNINEETVALIDKNELKKEKMRERIYTLINSRLTIMDKYKPIMRKTAQFLIMPQNICLGTKSLWEMADLMWNIAGDNSSDFSYYTKRTTLIAVYSSTSLFWLEDDSENHSETSKFLKRRINNVMQLAKLKEKMLSKTK